MKEKLNIFVEGIPGSGKTTLLDKLGNKFNDYSVYYEGEISPVELAWCAYMTEEQYSQALINWKELINYIKEKTVKEDSHYVVAYTKIKTEKYDFYEYMAKYEIYGGRKS